MEDRSSRAVSIAVSIAVASAWRRRPWRWRWRWGRGPWWWRWRWGRGPWSRSRWRRRQSRRRRRRRRPVVAVVAATRPVTICVPREGRVVQERGRSALLVSRAGVCVPGCARGASIVLVRQRSKHGMASNKCERRHVHGAFSPAGTSPSSPSPSPPVGGTRNSTD